MDQPQIWQVVAKVNVAQIQRAKRINASAVGNADAAKPQGRRAKMVKTTTVETTEKFGEDGKLVERITRNEASEDGTDYVPRTADAMDLADILPLGRISTCGHSEHECPKGERGPQGIPGECSNPALTPNDVSAVSIVAENVFVN